MTRCFAVCAMALNKYLDDYDERPDGPIAATVPVSLVLKKNQPEGSQSDGANQIGMMNVKLPIEIQGPDELIMAVNACSTEAKRVFERSFEDLLNTTVSAMPPQIAAAGMRLLSGGVVARYPISNVAISNIPGSPIPLYIEGARVIANYPMGPVPNGVGLNITMMSYVDRLDFCIQGCREKLPDPWLLVKYIETSTAELLTASGSKVSHSRPDKRATRRKTTAGTKKATSTRAKPKTAARKKIKPSTTKKRTIKKKK